MSKCGIIAIKNNSHTIFRSLYNIKYDQIGFINNNALWLYWTIPTNIDNYIGGEDNFVLKGGVMVYYKLHDKYNLLFEKAISSLTKKIKISLNDQYNNNTPLGIQYINLVFKEIGCSNLSENYISFDNINKFFNNCVIYKKDNTDNSVQCVDLLQLIAVNPAKILNYKVDILLIKCANIMSELIKNITSKQIIFNKQIIKNFFNITYEIHDFLNIDIVKYDLNLTEDILKIIENDGNILQNIKNIQEIVEKMVYGERIVDIKSLLDSTNKLLIMFNINNIKTPWITLPYSSFIGITNNNNILKFEENLISLSGDGLEKLSSEELKYFLEYISLMNTEVSYDGIKKKATELYYIKIQDKTNSS